MKRLFYIVTLILIIACEEDNGYMLTYPELYDPSNENELVIEMERDDGVKTSFAYDSLRRLVKLSEYLPPQILIDEFQYDSLNRVVKSMQYDRETFIGECKYIWANNTMDKIVYRIRDGELKKVGKITYYYNDIGLMIHEDVYMEEDGILNKMAYYEFTWQEQNLIKSELWGYLNKSINDNFGVPLLRDHEFLTKTNYSISIDTKVEMVKIQEETYKYDSKINPLRVITAGRVLQPFYIRYSKNNLTSSDFIDVYENEITYSYTYKYNNWQHPEQLNYQRIHDENPDEGSWDYYYLNLRE